MRIYKYTFYLIIVFLSATKINTAQTIFRDTLNQKYGLVDTSGEFIVEPRYDFMSKVCNNHVIIKEDSLTYTLIDTSKTVIFHFEYIPLSYDFIQEKICKTEYKDSDLIARLYKMCDYETRADRHKIASKCIIDMSIFSEYISCLLIDYIIDNLDKIEDDFIKDKEIEEYIRKGLKDGSIVIE